MLKKSLFILFSLILPSLAIAQPAQLPNFSLPDPDGGMHSSAQLNTNGMVIVVTAPTLHDKSAQEGWSKYLKATKGNNPANYVYIEDMSVSDFKGVAEKDLQKAWNEGKVPVLLLDKTGQVRKEFGVARDETKVFAYSKEGKLLYSYGGDPTEAVAKTLWSKLAAK